MTFDPSTIYCLATGKPIATISDDEFGFILESFADRVPLKDQPATFERLALSSMRPSIVWMNVTPESLDRMRDLAPRQLLAYLMNRLYAHVETDRYGKPLTSEGFLNARRQRIRNWSVIESANFSDETLDTLLLTLLELDSRFNLVKLVKPQSVTTLWDSWHEQNAKTLIQQLTDWRDSLVKAQIKREAQAKHAAEFWSEGNRLTRPAFTNQFMKIRPKSTPEQKVARTLKEQKAAKLAGYVDFLDELERDMMAANNVASEAVASVESAKPVAPKRFTRFGVKKDS